MSRSSQTLQATAVPASVGACDTRAPCKRSSPAVATAVRPVGTCNGPAGPYGPCRPHSAAGPRRRNLQRPRRAIRGPVLRRVLQGGAASEPATARRAIREDMRSGSGDAHRTAPGVITANRTGAGGAARTRTGGDGRSQIAATADRKSWRRRPDSNRGWRFCRPLPCHLATAPSGQRRDRHEKTAARGHSAGAAVRAWRGADRPRRRKVERETGFEPATSTMARSHSTTELFPLAPNAPSTVPQGEASLQDLCQAGRATPQRRPAGVPAPRRRHPCQAGRATPRQRRGSDRLRTWSRWPSRSGRCAASTARQRPAPDATAAARTQRRSRRQAPGR